MKENIFYAEDVRGRPLVVHRPSGSFAIYRYKDMSENERKFVIEYFCCFSSDKFLNKEEKKKSAEDFLDYKTEEDFCG